MKKLVNPFTVHSKEEYNCFGCSPNNESGLQLEFWEDNEDLVTWWNPRKWLLGYNNILHGGIQASLMDEIAGWVVLIKCKTAGVTTDLNIKYMKPVSIEKGKIEIRARLLAFENNDAHIFCELKDGVGLICATGEVRYFCYPEHIARRKLHYPGIDAFYSSGNLSHI